MSITNGSEPAVFKFTVLQCDQIGQLLKGLGYKSAYEVRPIIGNVFGLFLENGPFRQNLLWLLFLTFWTKLGYFLFQHLVTLLFC